MNSLIPIEEAIYYLEETLRESSQLRRCYTPKATIFQNWLIGVNNTLTIIFGAATLMWLIDCIASAIEGEGFISFELPLDIWISIWTVVGGIFFYFIILLIFFIQEKRNAKTTNQVEN